jgi:hypothetical protein
MASKSALLLLLVVAILAKAADGGPVAGGLCYTACNAGYVTCMSSSGLVAGVSGPVGWWAWLTGAAATCSAIQGTCMVACAAVFAAPTP